MVAAQGDWRKPSYYYSKGVFDIPMENNTNIAYDKPFKTYEEMLSLMSSRNIIISNPAFAKKFLRDFHIIPLSMDIKIHFYQYRAVIILLRALPSSNYTPYII